MFLDKYKNIICFDTETTGLNFKDDDIIEFAMLVFSNENNVLTKKYQIDVFVKTSFNIETKMTDRLNANGEPMSISELTHIKNKDVQNGVEQDKIAKNVWNLFFQPDTLITGYNIFFDMNMVRGLLRKTGYSEADIANALASVDYLDFYTVYMDNYHYSFFKVQNKRLGHTLDAAVKNFKITHKNTHRAIDDTIATWMVGDVLKDEVRNIDKYINVFGYNLKYEFDENNKFGKKTKFLPVDHSRLGSIYGQL